MRVLTLSALAVLAVTLTACDKHNQSQLQHDTHAVANDLKSDVRKIGDNADVKKAAAEVKKTAAEAGHAIKSTAHDASNAAHHAADDTHHSGDHS